MGTERRGFASMTPAKRREIASLGGKRAHERGTAHKWTSEAARNASIKSLEARHRKKADASTEDTTP